MPMRRRLCVRCKNLRLTKISRKECNTCCVSCPANFFDDPSHFKLNEIFTDIYLNINSSIQSAMDFEELLISGDRLENNIKTLVEENAIKKAEIDELQSAILRNSEREFQRLSKTESQLLVELQELTVKKRQTDIKLKQFTDVNTKLNLILEESSKDKQANKSQTQNDEIYKFVLDVMNEFETIKSEFSEASRGVVSLDKTLSSDIKTGKDLVVENRNIVNACDKNEALLNIILEQNRFSEQQFDLILEQIPWTPLTDNYINELRQSEDKNILDVAEVLNILTRDLNDLIAHMESKKTRKLEILEKLQEQLNDFIKKREEAILMNPNFRSKRNYN